MRPRDVRIQAERHAAAARQKTGDKRREAGGGIAGWVAGRAAEWNLSGQDETTMQRQKLLWNALVDYWFRIEVDGWENLPRQRLALGRC